MVLSLLHEALKRVCLMMPTVVNCAHYNTPSFPADTSDWKNLSSFEKKSHTMVIPSMLRTITRTITTLYMSCCNFRQFNPQRTQKFSQRVDLSDSIQNN